MKKELEERLKLAFNGTPEDLMGRLYSEVGAVKMTNLRLLMKEGDGEEPAGMGRRSSIILRAVQVQVKILTESWRLAGLSEEEWPTSLQVIWDAMLAVPELRGLLNRTRIREKLIAELRRQNEAQNGNNDEE